MKKLKMFMGLAMAAALLCHTTTTVWAAATHVEGCSNTTYTYAECGRLLDTPIIRQHVVYEGNVGKQCNVVAEIRMHNLLCANSSCRVLMESNVADTCSETHTYCGDVDTGLCKQ